jgi:hypothetical protein
MQCLHQAFDFLGRMSLDLQLWRLKPDTTMSLGDHPQREYLKSNRKHHSDRSGTPQQIYDFWNHPDHSHTQRFASLSMIGARKGTGTIVVGIISHVCVAKPCTHGVTFAPPPQNYGFTGLNDVAPDPIWTPSSHRQMPAEEAVKIGERTLIRHAGQRTELAGADVLLAPTMAAT